MNGRGQGEISRDEAIVAALAAGLSQREAAERGGTTSRTVRRRLQDPIFLEWLEEAKQNVHDSQRVYAALARAREAWAFVEDIEPQDWHDITTIEAKRLLQDVVKWLDEWAWLLEEECAS